VVAVGEIGAEVGQVVSFGAKVVVDDVEDDGEAVLVGGVDEALEAAGTAIGVLDGEGIDDVVAPIAGTRELGYGHEFEGGNAQFLELLQVGEDGVEGALGGVGTCVYLVKNVIPKGEPDPGGVGPGKLRIEHSRGAVHAVRLPAGGGVGSLGLPVESVKVVGARSDSLEPGAVITVRLPGEGKDAFVPSRQMEFDKSGGGCPDAEGAVVRALVAGS
jgi:hypothetical protein